MIDFIFNRLFDYYNVAEIKDLAQKMDLTPAALSNWKKRNALPAIRKKCRELGIYQDIFGDLNQSQNIEHPKDLLKKSLENYFTALKAVAIATNQEEELRNDIKVLMKKYIQ
jgi:hypothetical protein